MKHRHLFLTLTATLLLSLPSTPVLAIHDVPVVPPPPVVPVVPPPPVVPVGIAVQAAQISANTINVTQFKGGDPLAPETVAQDPPADEAEKTAETVAPPENDGLAPKSPRN